MDQATLTVKLRSVANADTIRTELHHLHKMGLVQKFVRPSSPLGGPPKVIWRATTELLKYYQENGKT